MVGYAGWTLERATISDATIPILADGIKWLGYLPKAHLLWNLGFYGDSLSEGQSFSTYGRQVAANCPVSRKYGAGFVSGRDRSRNRSSFGLPTRALMPM